MTRSKAPPSDQERTQAGRRPVDSAVDGAADKLRGHGLVHVGRIELPANDTFSLVTEPAEAAHWEKASYGFAIGDEWGRGGRRSGGACTVHSQRPVFTRNRADLLAEPGLSRKTPRP